MCGALLQGCESTHHINNKYLFYHEKSYDDVIEDGFSKKRLPIFTTQESSRYFLFEQYSHSAAMRDKTYYESISQVQTSLIQRLSQRTHIQRSDVYYNESPHQVSLITDKTMLSLIKQYIDLFDAMDVKDFTFLFPEDYSDESGGIIVHDKQLKLVELENIFRGSQIKNYYNNNDVYIYSQTGMYHTHSLRESCTEFLDDQSYVYVGPNVSAYVKEPASLHNNMSSDLAFFKTRSAMNPYYVDAEIIQLEHFNSQTSKHTYSYNVDIYFLQDGCPMVLDIGTYTFEEKKNK